MSDAPIAGSAATDGRPAQPGQQHGKDDSDYYMDAKLLRAISIAEQNAYLAYSLTLAWDAPERVKRAHAYMTAEPQIGDLVLETSTIRIPQYDGSRLGILENVEQRGTQDNSAVRRAIRLLDGTLMHWSSAGFIRVTEEIDHRAEQE